VRIELPYRWNTRDYQEPLWDYLAGGGRNAVAIWHRRAGKDDLALQHTVCALHQRKGSYVHMLPEYEQARRALWDQVDSNTGVRRIDQIFPKELRESTRDDTMFIRFKCGSTWQLMGSDRYNAAMGAGFCGIVFSEFALGNPAAYSYFSPMLAENNGWRVVITTPRGHNHAEMLYKHAAKEMRAGGDYFAQILTAEQTGAISPQILQDELASMCALHGEAFGRALWLQEYFASFEAAIPGSIFGEDMARARAEGRIGVVPIEPDIPVHTGWDLGRTDDTSIWWFQMLGNEPRLIDYEADNFKEIPHYAQLLKDKAEERGFKYGYNYLPHDAKPVKLGMGGKSILQQFVDWNRDRNNCLGQFIVMPPYAKTEQIQATRATLAKAWIDESHCGDGLSCITQYHREWDDEKRVFTDKPVHDWSSHGVDALATVAMSWRANKVAKEDQQPTPERLIAGSVQGRTMGDMRKEFFKRQRARREGSL
jgi:hypothetical protein